MSFISRVSALTLPSATSTLALAFALTASTVEPRPMSGGAAHVATSSTAALPAATATSLLADWNAKDSCSPMPTAHFGDQPSPAATAAAGSSKANNRTNDAGSPLSANGLMDCRVMPSGASTSTMRPRASTLHTMVSSAMSGNCGDGCPLSLSLS